jgi:Cu(I)/Ag(I) efflux system membrane protein CusA/SilA
LLKNQVTYPLTTTMLSVPGAKTVRGFSQFGDSYVYVIFEDGTDPYWARARTGVPQPGSGKITGWR